MLAVKLLPETVRFWGEEFVPICKLPKSGNEFVDTVIVGVKEQLGAVADKVPFELFVLPAEFFALT